MVAERGGKRLVSSRPTMSLMIRFSISGRLPGSLSAGKVLTVWPSRSTVIVSAISATSPSLCEMMIEVSPWRLNSRMSSRSAALSFSFSDEVGSSRIRSSTFFDSALAISTSCCLPVPRLPISVAEFSLSPTFLSSSVARAWASCQSMMPFFAVSLPRKMFSAIERSGTSASSW